MKESNNDALIVRRPWVEDMPAVFLFGYDAWSEERSADEHVALCQSLKKYAKGTWYIVERDGRPLSTLICYRDAFNLPNGVVGIGSVATAPDQRRRGFASFLMREVMARLTEASEVAGYFLYSDIDPRVYEKLGFVRLEKEFQRYEGSVAMLRPGLRSVDSLVRPGFQAPDYF